MGVRKAQISTEYLLLIGLLLLALIPLIYYATREANLAVTQSSGEDVVKTLAAAADEVFALGPGSRKTVEVNMPKGVVGHSIGGTEEASKKEIKLIISIYGGEADIIAITKSEVRGGIPTNSGQKRIEIVALEDHVLIGVDTFPPVVISTSPTGTISDSSPKLVAITDEAAMCEFVSGDINFDYGDETPMSGNGTSHTSQLTGLDEDSYTYSVKCNDTVGNIMTNQALIQFTVSFVSGDFDAPEVDLIAPANNYVENATSLITFKYKTCDPTFTDCGNVSAISKCTLRLTQTGGNTTITVEDQDVTEDVTEDFRVSLGDGEYFWKVTCIDTSANANEGESETRKVTIDTGAGGGGQVIGSLEDFGLDAGFHYKSNGVGAITADSVLKTKTDITDEFLDDNVNTPSTTAVVRTSGDTYEGYIVEENREAANYDKIVLFGRVRIVDIDPFIIRVFAYNSDGDTIDTSLNLSFSIPASILNEQVKWVELDVTNLSVLEQGDGKLKFRIYAPHSPEQSENKRFQFSELHIKGGIYA